MCIWRRSCDINYWEKENSSLIFPWVSHRSCDRSCDRSCSCHYWVYDYWVYDTCDRSCLCHYWDYNYWVYNYWVYDTWSIIYSLWLLREKEIIIDLPFGFPIINIICHIWMSHVTHMNESCHTYEWAMSHIWMSHVTHIRRQHYLYVWHRLI